MTALLLLGGLAFAILGWFVRDLQDRVDRKAPAADLADLRVKLEGWLRRLGAEVARDRLRWTARDASIDAVRADLRRVARLAGIGPARDQGESDADYERRIEEEVRGR